MCDPLRTEEVDSYTAQLRNLSIGMNLNTRVKHELAPGGQGHADYVIVEESPDLLKDPAGYSRLVFRAVASQIEAMIRPLRGRIVVDHNGEGILGRLVAELGEVSTYGYVMPALSAAEILSYVVPYVNVVTVKQLLALGRDVSLVPGEACPRSGSKSSGCVSVQCIDYRCNNRRFWLPAHGCQVPTPSSQNRELEQQIRIFGAD